MGRGRKLTREDQLANWAEVRRLLGLGLTKRNIARQMRGKISLPTVYAYAASLAPPDPRWPKRGKHGPRNPVRSEIPLEVSELREQIVQTFLHGDLATHALLVQKMHTLLAEMRPVELPQAAALEAAE